MRVFFIQSPDLKLPIKANPTDAGYDIFASTEPKIVGDIIGSPTNYNYYKRIDYIEYGTNLFVKPQSSIDVSQWFAPKPIDSLELRPRSSISKYNLLLANSPATIDESYRGEIKVRFKYILQPEDIRIIDEVIYISPNIDKIYKKDDRIVQILPHVESSIQWLAVDSLDETKRGNGGFGSSGN